MKKFSVTVSEELFDGLEEFRGSLDVAVSRSEVVEAMLFYCLGDDDALEDIADGIEGEEEEESEEED